MRARSREFAAACDWIGALAVPVTVEVGNHDLPYFNLLERFLDSSRRICGHDVLVARKIDLPGLALLPLTTTARAQWRLQWLKGRVANKALGRIGRAQRGGRGDKKG